MELVSDTIRDPSSAANTAQAFLWPSMEGSSSTWQ